MHTNLKMIRVLCMDLRLICFRRHAHNELEKGKSRQNSPFMESFNPKSR
jgi:hypothetical protein